MQGPIAKLMEGVFYENFSESGDVLAPELDDGAEEPGAEGLAMVLAGAPTGGNSDLKRAYLLGIAMARRTIDITSPYFVVDESTLWSLQDAVRRGVKVRILMEGDETDARPVKYASRAWYEPLLAAGVELYEYRPTMMHAKVFVVDGVWSMFGSANFDNRSLELNDELNVAATNRGLAERLLRDFAQDLRASTRIDPESWRRRSPLEKVREQFWSYFGEVF
jgi:cardiolipin synthase